MEECKRADEGERNRGGVLVSPSAKICEALKAAFFPLAVGLAENNRTVIHQHPPRLRSFTLALRAGGRLCSLESRLLPCLRGN